MSYANTARLSQSHSALPARRPRASTAAVRWLRALLRMHERRRQRQALLDLNDHLLRDIAVTRKQAQREGGKPFWM